MLTTDLDEKSLLASAAILLRSADALRAITPSEANASPNGQMFQKSALAELQTEFGLYLAYVATVLEVIAKLPQPDDWQTADGEHKTRVSANNIFDQLASIRQALTVSASVGRQRLVAFRSSQSLDVHSMSIA